MALHHTFKREALDGMLQALPVHVFYFDHDLMCRYAAPIGPRFLGQPADELLGRPLEGIFPPDLSLRPQLETVLQTQQPWRSDHLPYPSGPQDAWPAGAWRIHAHPYAPDDGPLPSPTASDGHQHALQYKPAVLVSCIEKPCEEHWVLPAGVPFGDDTAARLPNWATSGVESPRVAALLERIRTKLTIVRGFTQLLRRRYRRENPDVDVHELDRISGAVRQLDELLYQYEYGDDPIH